MVKARRTLTEGPIAESDRHALTLDAVRALDRAAAKGILHRNNAARRKARLTRQMAKLAIAPAPAAKGKKGAAAARAAAKPAAATATAKTVAATSTSTTTTTTKTKKK